MMNLFMLVMFLVPATPIPACRCRDLGPLMVKIFVTYIFYIGLVYKYDYISIMDVSVWAFVKEWLLD